ILKARGEGLRSMIPCSPPHGSTVRINPRHSERRYPMPTLVIDLLGKRKRIKLEQSASIGRAKNNDVAIDHPALSRTHALTDSADSVFFIEDGGSANCTLLDGQPLEVRSMLFDGARIEMGPTKITFHTDDQVIDTAEPKQEGSTSVVAQGILLNCSC